MFLEITQVYEYTCLLGDQQVNVLYRQTAISFVNGGMQLLGQAREF